MALHRSPRLLPNAMYTELDLSDANPLRGPVSVDVNAKAILAEKSASRPSIFCYKGGEKRLVFFLGVD